MFEVRRENGEGPTQTLHRNLLLPIGDLPIQATETETKKPQQDGAHQGDRIEVEMETSEELAKGTESESSDEELVVLQNTKQTPNMAPQEQVSISDW